MWKNNFFLLQFIIIIFVAGIFSLLWIKLYPSGKTLLQNTGMIKQIPEAEVLSVTETEKEKIQKVSPHAIKIPSVGTDLVIDAGKIVNNNWTLFDDKVSWLATSQVPGRGNVILYAHNMEHLFGPLKNINIEDIIYLDHENNRYSYEVMSFRTVTPEDVGAVLSNDDQLTLYTCDGSFDQKRLVVYAKPVKVVLN